MGKKNKEAAAETETKAEKKSAAPEFKFGVADLAEELGIEPASVRVQLRNKKVEKAGKSYGWNSKAELKEIATLLKTKPEGKAEGKKSKKAAAADDAGDADEAPKKKKGKKGK